LIGYERRSLERIRLRKIKIYALVDVFDLELIS
jgi:hypothetical protein